MPRSATPFQGLAFRRFSTINHKHIVKIGDSPVCPYGDRRCGGYRDLSGLILSSQAALGLLACAHAYDIARKENPLDPRLREHAAILARQVDDFGHAGSESDPSGLSLADGWATMVTQCDTQFRQPFGEVSDWLAHGAGYANPSPDPAALEWNRKAAAAGSAEGLWRVGHAYRYAGSGVTPDREEAHRWFRMAVARGHPDAALQLYQDLYPDDAPGAASADAIALLDLALAGRLPDAAYQMALAIFLGVRGNGDPVLAAAWMHIAAREGSELGIDSLPNVLEPLNSAQREAALVLSQTLQK